MSDSGLSDPAPPASGLPVGGAQAGHPEGSSTSAQALPADLVALDPSSVEFILEGVDLKMRKAGSPEWAVVQLARLFPLTHPRAWIAIRDKDGKELGVILDLAAFGDTSEKAVLAALDRRYIVPQITRVIMAKERREFVEWRVETDKGMRRFVTHHAREQIKHPLPTYLIITDLAGDRYDVPDLASLDPESRRLLEERW